MIGMFAAPVWACDLQASTKQRVAASYVSEVQQCLADLPEGYAFDAAIEQDNFRRVNEARRARGLQPLKLRRDLLNAARWHSVDMAANAYFSHRGQDGRSHDQRVSLLDRTLIYDASRENIAMMRGSYRPGAESETLHSGLMRSPGHYENIMADNISHMAVGVVRRGDGVWLTQLFVNEAGELSEPAPLRLVRGQHFAMNARLNGWTFSGFQVEQGKQLRKLQTTQPAGRPIIPVELAGDVVLGVRGERRAESSAQRGYYINLSGPSITLVSNAPRTNKSRRIIRTRITEKTSEEAS